MRGSLPSGMVPVGVFLGAIVFTFALALRWLVSRRGPLPEGGCPRLFRRVGWVFAAAAAVGLLCMAWGFLVEPKLLKTTYYEIPSGKLAPGQRIRIAHVADIHARTDGYRERRLRELVQAAEPDLILHTGDFFSTTEESGRVVLSLLGSLEAPQFACEGNLDRLAPFDAILRDAGVAVLNGHVARTRVRDLDITITGFAHRPAPALLQGLPGDTVNIVLNHYPSGFERVMGTGADLMLAGHTHGGQVRLPFYGALVTLDTFGKRWESGMYQEGGAYLVVSRGIGCEPNVPEVRFLCRPELVVIDIVPALVAGE